jgi:decaprenylphospho-beta-D-ribofuranose 2-oxidase
MEVASGPASGAKSAAVPLRATRRLLCGYGRVAPSRAWVIAPRSAEELADALGALRGRPGGLIARGAGRAYGDAAQNAGGHVLDMTALDWIGEVEGEESYTIRVGAGATLGAILKRVLPRGLMLTVTPGTKHVTVGGAIAADIHGKNHPADGSFARCVRSLVICTPAGELRELSRRREGELFAATLGGMGLTGVICEATLALERMPSGALVGEVDRGGDLGAMLELMSGRGGHRYAVAWIDLLGDLPSGAPRRRRGFGRGVAVRSDFLEGDKPHEGGSSGAGAGEDAWHAGPAERPRLRVPDRFDFQVLRTPMIRAFNALRYRLSPVHASARPLPFNAHFFPLDALANWNRLYGKSGFIQYQFVLPSGREQALEQVLLCLDRARLPVYLAVLKRFGEPSGGLLSFPIEGFTVALDIPAGAPGLHAALARADELVAGAGGRVYLAKDVRLGARAMAAMYPQLERFCELRGALDPDGLLRSDLGRRLGLLGGGREQ